METPKEYYYTYYSYEEWGRGYFGSRKCYCLPEEDTKYLGSSKDKTFKPKYKIILKDDYATRQEAYADEIVLHDYYDVANNPHFANKSKQTSTKFRCPVEVFRTKEFREKASFRAKGELNHICVKGGKITGNENKKLGRGICGLTTEERSENSKRNYENGIGIASLTFEDKSKAGKKGSAKNKENKVGIFSMKKEELSLAGKKSYEVRASKGQDLFSTMSIEERRINAKKTNSQKWMCLETGYITNAGALTTYQRKRKIDTSKRKRIA